MIRGIGTDIVEVSRIDRVLARQSHAFADRILVPEEKDHFLSHKYQSRYLAKRFSVKEAVAKALGTGIGRGVSWQDIQIANNEQGAPKVILTGGALERMQQLGGTTCFISISDEKHYVVAMAVIE